MSNRLFKTVVLLTALLLTVGCGGGGKSKKKIRLPQPPAPIVVPPADNSGGEGAGSESTETTGSEGTGSEGTGSEGTGSEGTGSEGTGGDDTDPFALPDGKIDPTDPIFPGGETTPGGNNGTDHSGGSENLVPQFDTVAMPEPTTLLTTLIGAGLLGLRRQRRNSPV